MQLNLARFSEADTGGIAKVVNAKLFYPYGMGFGLI